MKKTRVLAVLAAAVLAAVPMAGCKDKQSDGNTGELVGNTYKTGLPMVKDKTELSVMIYKNTLHGDFSKMTFSTWLEEKANIKINWQYCGWGADAVQKKTLAFSSGNYPDLMILPPGSFYDYDATVYGKQGHIKNLAPYINDWAPNIKAMFDKYPEIRQASETDGKIFTLPRVEYNDRHVVYNLKHYIRKSWLDTLGLQVPKTTEQFYETLKAFRDNDPNGNGQKDEIPFVYTNLDPSLLANWGLNYGETTYNMNLNQKTGKIEYAFGSDGMRNALKYLNRLTTEKLLDREIFEDPSMATPAIKDGKVGSFCSFGSFVEAGYDLASEYVMLEPLETGLNDKMSYYAAFDNVYPHMFMVTKKCQNVEAAMRLVDYFYSPEGYTLANLGAPGDVYEIKDDGKIQSLKEIDEQERHKLAPCGSMIWGVDNTLTDRQVQKADSELGQVGKAEKQLKQDCESKLKPFIPKNLLRKPFLSEDTSRMIIDKGAPLNEFAKYNCMLFLIGEKNIDSEWNDHISEMKKLGMDELVAGYQAAYDKTYG